MSFVFLPSLVFFVLTLGSIVYYLYSFYACYDFFQQKNKIDLSFSPSISILKPLHGLESNLEENLTSFINQSYPNYQIIFCVRDKNDPVILLVEKLINQYVDRDLKLVVDDRVIGYNYKISNVANGLKYCRHELILIADSDIKVKEDYLSSIVQPFKEENVAVVTCLYQSMANHFTGIIESLEVSNNFIPSVLVARKLEGIKFAFGSTILISKKVLEKIDNFNQIANSLADDYLLGNLPTKLGYQTELVKYIVQHEIEKEELKDYLARQIRWCRCIKSERFAGYLGMIFTYGIVNSLFFLIFHGVSLISILLLLVVLLLKLLLGYQLGFKYLNNTTIQENLGLVIVVDLIKFYLWIVGLWGNKISWKNHQFILKKKGLLELKR